MHKAAHSIPPSHRPRFLAWPGWRHLLFAVSIGTCWSLVFYAVYGGTAYITDLHTIRLRVDFPFEQRIPLVPAMAVIYLSLLVGMQFSPFIIRERCAYLRYAFALTAQLFVASIFFVLLPTRLGFEAPQPTGTFADLLHFADVINLDHNNVPSLHVAFALTTAKAYGYYTRGVGTKVAIFSFAVLVIASTILTHQHHIVDVIAGYVLARFVGDRFLDRGRRPVQFP